MSHSGHATALLWTMSNVYDMRPGQVFWGASDIGWVVGHSYIVYGPLLAGCTTVLYEGKPVGTPDAGAFWRLIADHGVRTLFTAPTALRAIRRADPEAAMLVGHDLSSFKHLFLAGERLDIDTLQWAEKHLPVDVTDHWWQTETGWAITATPRGIEDITIEPGSAGVPMPGFRVRVVDAKGASLRAGTEGSIVLDQPLPPGALSTLWRSPDRFDESYFEAIPGSYTTGDSGYLTEEGQLVVLGRSDDVINVAGHRLSTGAIEGIVATHPAVAECAVVAAQDELKGQMPVVLVVVVDGADIPTDDLAGEITKLIRHNIGAIAAPRSITRVNRLPKTRSGKILRKTLRAIADGRGYEIPTTIEDPAALDEAAEAMRAAQLMSRR